MMSIFDYAKGTLILLVYIVFMGWVQNAFG